MTIIETGWVIWKYTVYMISYAWWCHIVDLSAKEISIFVDIFYFDDGNVFVMVLTESLILLRNFVGQTEYFWRI